MPSRFPGVDPYVESQLWEDFHTRFITILSESLVPQVRPQYSVVVERYVYVTNEAEEAVSIIAPDTFLAETGHGRRDATLGQGTVTLEPVQHRIPLPRRRQPYLAIRTRQKQRVVTIVELLSPWNKTRAAGMTEYLNKRANVLDSTANLVELDLLRGGERLPTEQPLQPGDFYAFISRPSAVPEVAVYAWTLRDPNPSLPIPLADSDPDVVIDLQQVYQTTYDRAGYDYSLDYDEAIKPPLCPADAKWEKSLRPGYTH